MEVQLFTQKNEMAERAPQISPVLVQKKPEHAFGKVRCRFQGRALEEDAEQPGEAVLRLIKQLIATKREGNAEPQSCDTSKSCSL